MKALIWIGCVVSLSLCTVLIRYCGIVLGGIPSALMFAGMWWLATTLCKKWDARKQQNGDEEQDKSEGDFS